MIYLRVIIALLFLVSPALATDNPRLISYPPQKIMGFRGLDTKSNAPNLEDGRATVATNVKLSSAFDLRKRYGVSVINTTLDTASTTSPSITGLFDASYSTGTNFALVFVGSELYYNNSNVWTKVLGGGAITSGQDYQWNCNMALDSAICTNDEDAPLKISSTPTKNALEFTGLTNAVTKVKTFAWFRNYLIAGNTVEAAAEKPQRIRWSNVGTIETWTDADFIDIGSLAGDELIGFKELYGNLYAFLKKSIWKISLVGGDDVFSFTKIIDTTGAVATNSIQTVRLPNNQYGIIFLDENKRIYLFNGIAVLNIGDIIQPTLDSLNESRIKYAVSGYDDEDYFLCVTDSGGTENDVCFDYQIDINEWTKYTQIDANAMARVVVSSAIKIYYGNYESFVYWIANPDKNNDVEGATGIVDSVSHVNTATITGAQILIDSEIVQREYTGATVKITGGTAAGEEHVIIASTSTGIIVATAFSTTPDSTSVYSIGAIDADYETKWYDLGDSARKKNYKALYFWTAEDSDNEVTVSYASDFGVNIEGLDESLAPSADSLWGTALWDEGVWGTTGDKFHKINLKGTGRMLQLKFDNSDIDETFQVYGYNILADALDIR